MSEAMTTNLRFLKIERRIERIERRLSLSAPIEFDRAVADGLDDPALPTTTLGSAMGASLAPPLPPVPASASVDSIAPDYDERGFDLNRSSPSRTASAAQSGATSDAFMARDSAVAPYDAAPQAPQAPHAPNAPYAGPTPPPLPSARLMYERMQPTHPAPPPARHLEQTIGLKWAGWIGAVVLVIGAVLGIKYAYDNHLLPVIGPAGKTALIVAAGALLLVAGEYVYRKINTISATGLFGAGVATLFLAAYAGHAYALYTPNTTMALMGGAALIGALVAMRGNLVSIAVLSLIGANLAPMLVGSRGAPIGPFLVYLLAMQIVALALSTWGRAAKWWTLRGLSLALTAMWMTGLLFSEHRSETVVIGFLITYALLYHVELIVSTLIAKSPPARAAGVTFALIVTTALSLGVLRYFIDASDALRATWMLSIAAISFLLGLALPKLRDTLVPLARTHRIAAAGLLVLVVPVAMNGTNVELGWATLALAFGASWIATGSHVSRIAAPMTWLLALAHLAARALDRHDVYAASSDVWLTIFSTPITVQALAFGGLAIVGQIVARLISTPRDLAVEPRNDRAIRAMSVAATLVWSAAAIAYLPALGATTAIVLFAWLLMLADRFAARLSLAVQAGALLLIATVKWAIVDTLAQRLSPDWSATRYLPVFNPMMGVGALVTLSLIALYYLKRKPILNALKRSSADDTTRGAIWLISAVIALVTIGLSFEVEHIIERATALGHHSVWPLWQTKQLAWTVLWSLAGVSIVGLLSRMLGDRPDRARRMRAVMLLPIALILKYVFIDTVMYRVAGVTGARAIFNLQMLAGVATLGSVIVTRSLVAPHSARVGILRQLRGGVGMLVLAMIAWMGTLEIDRAVERGTFNFLITIATTTAFMWHVKMLLFTIWWCALVGGAYLLACNKDRTAGPGESWVKVLPAAMLLIAGKYLVIDAIVGWISIGSAPWPVVINVEAMAAALVVGMLALLKLIAPPEAAAAHIARKLRPAMTLLVAVLFVAGTLEVDRAFTLPSVRAALTNARLAEQVALSIFWAIFAAVAVALGFRIRIAGLRYFGLALLAITLLKVVLIDLSQIGTGYRILSFIGLGIVLLGTSVLYGKVSPKLR